MNFRQSVRCALFVVLGIALPLVAQNAPPGATRQKAIGQTPSDVELVERVIATRHDYQISLEQLRSHYIYVGDPERARWAEDELRQYHRIVKQPYRLDLDVPPPTLKATYNIPEANALYTRALDYKGKGSGDTYTDNQRRTEILLQQLLTSYPQSDKIGDAAYQLGDLYEGRSYKQPQRAALYFERCFQWHPNTHFDARMRAARIYDKVLGERSHAIELYKEAVQHETDPKHLEEARKRLAELQAGR